MKMLASAIAALSLAGAAVAQAQESKMSQNVQAVAPALDKYTQGTLLGEVWRRPSLTMRDRSIMTLAALIARNQTVEVAFYLNRALDNGVKPAEISETITHLAFYSGWANAVSAAGIAKDVFAARKIGLDQLPSAAPTLLPIDDAAEKKRATLVTSNSELCHLASCNTRPMRCSATSGCVLTLRRATAALSPSALWSQPDRSRRFLTTSAGQWITG